MEYLQEKDEISSHVPAVEIYDHVKRLEKVKTDEIVATFELLAEEGWIEFKDGNYVGLTSRGQLEFLPYFTDVQ